MKKRKRDVAYKFLIIVIFILIWEASSRLGLLDPQFIPSFSNIVDTLFNIFLSENFIVNVGISVERALLGFIVSILIGIPLGFLLGGWFQKLDLVMEPVIEIFSQVNPFILFHIFLLLLGIGEGTKIAVIAWTCTWPIMFNTIYGIRHVDQLLLKEARSFGITRTKLFYKVVVPATLPSIFVGIRISAGYSFFMLIAAEMMGASSGLGWLLLSYQQIYDIKRIFATAVIIAFLGLILDIIIKNIQNVFAAGRENN
ncbi:MAG: ABC transporter permease [Clostridium sp.]|uniref:ABC transporter permease n=1 Tax=Clostridium sp. TaxID=1506 RepID=UPI0025BE2EA6|nr:ABC transporter permease [Clostridium sp.]MCH3963719.1 ABC transporter permease [Clostridium sp.]MCI1714860.1 ABC transporter permease [Clostridium sp.]MCI1798951.1 ABC transporter permease [Clostridium sp.]MCI1813043.1 ABC transporter permease [Clostridium sp.]MCI1869933.1 ABC transporter permease [Clostridium sp.]